MNLTFHKIILILLILHNVSLSSQIGIGIHKIVIWKFWQKDDSGYEKSYLIFNPLNYNISLKAYVVDVLSNGVFVSTKIDSAIDTISPVEIGPSEYKFIDRFLESDVSDTEKLFKFKINDSISIGYYELVETQPEAFALQKIITTNVPHNGNEIRGAYWSQDKMVFYSNNYYKIILHINSLNNVSLFYPTSVLALTSSDEKFCNQVDSILDIKSTSLDRKRYSDRNISDAYMFSVPEHINESSHTITFSFKTPSVNQVTLKQLNAWLVYKNGTNNITLPLIIIPKQTGDKS